MLQKLNRGFIYPLLFMIIVGSLIAVAYLSYTWRQQTKAPDVIISSTVTPTINYGKAAQ